MGRKIRKKRTGGLLIGPSHEQGGILATTPGMPDVELEGGEYIINAQTVNALGTEFLDKLNSTQTTYHTGGFGAGELPSPSNYRRGGVIRKKRGGGKAQMRKGGRTRRKMPHGGPHPTRTPLNVNTGMARRGSHTHNVNAGRLASAMEIPIRQHYHPDLGQSQFSSAEVSATYQPTATSTLGALNTLVDGEQGISTTGNHIHRRGGKIGRNKMRKGGNIKRMPHGGRHNGNGRTANDNPVTRTFFAPQSPRYYRPNGQIIPVGAPLHEHQDGTIMTEHSMGPNDNSVVVTTTRQTSRQTTNGAGRNRNRASGMGRMTTTMRSSSGYKRGGNIRKMPHGGRHDGTQLFCPNGNYGYNEFGDRVCV